jgi:hypothetical protein
MPMSTLAIFNDMQAGPKPEYNRDGEPFYSEAEVNRYLTFMRLLRLADSLKLDEVPVDAFDDHLD